MLSSLAVAISSRPKRSLLIVMIVVIVAGVVGGPVAGALKGSGGFAPGNSDSQLATDQLEHATGLEPTAGIVLLVSTPQGARAAAPRLAAVRRELAGIPGVAQTARHAVVARDGRHVLVTGTLRASADDKQVAKAAEQQFSHAGDVTVGGPAVANEQINDTVTGDLAKAELIAFPLLIILSLLFFRGRAALMPLIVGIATVLGTFLVLTGVNHVYGLSVFALNLVIGLGLGLAVDYTLFLVTRYREELALQGNSAGAIATTMSHAGRAVLFSAVTVACALATLTVFPQGFLKSMGMAGAIVALVAALAALTITPALLGLWGAKLARRGTGGEAGAEHSTRWYRFARWVMRRPGPVAIVTAAVMVAAAIPALGTVWTPADGSSVIPQGKSARTVADALTRDFAGAGRSPVTVAVTAPGTDRAAIDRYARRVGGLHGVTGVTPPRFLGRATWQLDAAVTGDPSGAEAQRVVTQVRALAPAFPTRVTGDAATFVDQQAAISSHLPLAIGLLAVLTYLVLWLMTDSVVLPLKAIVMNALTVGASLAPLIVIYQHGRLTGLLGYTPNGGVEPTDFVVAATVVFALSTDYGVILLSRIKEAQDAEDGRDRFREAVAVGLGATGRVVTAAAILLAVAIGAFSTSSISFIQQIGVATATGVLLDAFVVRSLLVPSLMALLGRLNWYSPRFMHRLRARIVPAQAQAQAPGPRPANAPPIAAKPA
jgi:trehalose monomycolate/heme transporter